ncbi:AMP-binding protein [Saccharopolyspora shandongensis]|uniref:AMP-binding protein n=1 Tax=Saccharopolyspora shandongensis TaxID=418495 RepID=UPI00343C5882
MSLAVGELGVFNIARTDPGRPAVIDATGRAVGFAELAERANQLSHALRAMGLRPGDSVGAVIHNGLPYFELRLATWQCGLYFTPINHHLAAAEIGYIAENCEAKLVVVDASLTELCGPALDAAGVAAELRFAIGGSPGWRDYEELFEGQPRTAPDERTGGEVMLYTSGTTGRPKGVRRPLTGRPPAVSQYHLDFMGRLDIEPGAGVHLVLSPLYHAAPGTFAFTGLNFGHTVVLSERAKPEEVLRLVDEHRVTATFTVPTVLHRLLRLPAEVRDRYDTSSLRSVVHAGAPCPVDVKTRCIEWLGPVLTEFYGATEGSATAVRSAEWLTKPGTVGFPLPGAEIHVLDEQGEPLPAGEIGTVYFRSGISGIEYFKDPEKTATARHGDLITVGDVGYVDADGWLFLCDRRTDLILSGGVNIYPAEVEAALLAHPEVADVAVIGIPDEEWGQSVLAIVQPAPEAADGLTERLTAHCRERLAGFKVPRRIELSPQLPRTDTGKLLRRELRAPYWGA